MDGLAYPGLDLDLAAEHGHHIPGTPYTYKHGWKPIDPIATVGNKLPKGMWTAWHAHQAPDKSTIQTEGGTALLTKHGGGYSGKWLPSVNAAVPATVDDHPEDYAAVAELHLPANAKPIEKVKPVGSGKLTKAKIKKMPVGQKIQVTGTLPETKGKKSVWQKINEDQWQMVASNKDMTSWPSTSSEHFADVMTNDIVAAPDVKILGEHDYVTFADFPWQHPMPGPMEKPKKSALDKGANGLTPGMVYDSGDPKWKKKLETLPAGHKIIFSPGGKSFPENQAWISNGDGTFYNPYLGDKPGSQHGPAFGEGKSWKYVGPGPVEPAVDPNFPPGTIVSTDNDFDKMPIGTKITQPTNEGIPEGWYLEKAGPALWKEYEPGNDHHTNWYISDLQAAQENGASWKIAGGPPTTTGGTKTYDDLAHMDVGAQLKFTDQPGAWYTKDSKGMWYSDSGITYGTDELVGYQVSHGSLVDRKTKINAKPIKTAETVQPIAVPEGFKSRDVELGDESTFKHLTTEGGVQNALPRPQHFDGGIVETYTGSWASEVNNALRGQQYSPLNNFEKSGIKRMDDSMSSLQSDAIFYRGVPPVAFGVGDNNMRIEDVAGTKAKLEALVGKTITDEGFMSTTWDKDASVSASAPIVIKILAPKGTKALFAQPYSQFETEHEVVMEHSLHLKIRRIESIINSSSGKKQFLVVGEVVSPTTPEVAK